MPYTPVKGDFPEVWDFEKVPEVEFVLQNKKEGVGKYKKMLYTIEEVTSKELFDIWGGAIIDRQMQQMEVGQRGKLTFKGVVHSQKWGKDMQDFLLEIWEDEAAPAL
jgi:hypothetical protein